MTEVTLEFLAHKLQQVLDDLASVKDEQLVQGSMLRGLQNQMTGVQGQLNGLNSKLDRLDNRVRRLEDREPSHG